MITLMEQFQKKPVFSGYYNGATPINVFSGCI